MPLFVAIDGKIMNATMVITMEERPLLLGHMVKKLREERKLSKVALAKRAGISRAYIQLIERDKRGGNISVANLRALAEALEVDVNTLLDAESPPVPKAAHLDTMLREIKERYDALQLVEIPIRGAVPAGYPFPEEESREGFIEIPQGQLGAAARKTGLFALRVSGHSLSGDGINDGDIVVVEPDPDCVNGRIYAVRLGSEVLARHVHWLKDKVKFTAANGEYRELEAKEVEILGRIILSGRWRKH